MSDPDLALPNSSELFQRLSQLSMEMAETSQRIDGQLAAASFDGDQASLADLQDLDRLSQSLEQIGRVFEALAEQEASLSRQTIATALSRVTLPSLKAFLESGNAQTDRGDVELF